MSLDVKTRCEKCGTPLQADGEAYICASECTFCNSCAADESNVCPNCAGELVRRPKSSITRLQHIGVRPLTRVKVRPGLVWIFSIAIWTFAGLAATLTIYEFYRISGRTTPFGTVAGMEFCQFLAFIPVTPFAFMLALRYPIQRSNWLKPVLIHIAGGLVFNLGHGAIRSLTPYGYWDPVHREWTFAFWDTYAHTFRNVWAVGKEIFLTTVVDDVIAAYVPIVIVAHAFIYYRGLHERELRATRLEEQLASARLQTLKSQLQPHFLFNTLHSISALMATDVVAADRTMMLLADLLRMTLENEGGQLTTLSSEIEFLQVYLDIEKVRFEERLRVVFEIAPECLDAQVPHLLLQPLVENAVRHGIAKLAEGGEIQVIAKQGSKQSLEIWVRDNGPGLTDAREEKPKSGLGLRVTRERLAALYGEKQICEFRSSAKGGAEVYLQLPFSAAAVHTPSELTAEDSYSQLAG